MDSTFDTGTERNGSTIHNRMLGSGAVRRSATTEQYTFILEQDLLLFRVPRGKRRVQPEPKNHAFLCLVTNSVSEASLRPGGGNWWNGCLGVCVDNKKPLRLIFNDVPCSIPPIVVVVVVLKSGIFTRSDRFPPNATIYSAS